MKETILTPKFKIRQKVYIIEQKEFKELLDCDCCNNKRTLLVKGYTITCPKCKGGLYKYVYKYAFVFDKPYEINHIYCESSICKNGTIRNDYHYKLEFPDISYNIIHNIFYNYYSRGIPELRIFATKKEAMQFIKLNE